MQHLFSFPCLGTFGFINTLVEVVHDHYAKVMSLSALERLEEFGPTNSRAL